MLSNANKILSSGKYQEAAQIYQNILESEELQDKHVQAKAGLIRCAVMMKDFDRAKEFIDSLTAKVFQ